MYKRLLSSNVKELADPDATVTILTDVYNTLATIYPEQTSARRRTSRKLLSLSGGFGALLKSMATVIAESNALATQSIEAVSL